MLSWQRQWWTGHWKPPDEVIRAVVHKCVKSRTWILAALDMVVSGKESWIVCRSSQGNVAEFESAITVLRLDSESQFGQMAQVESF